MDLLAPCNIALNLLFKLSRDDLCVTGINSVEWGCVHNACAELTLEVFNPNRLVKKIYEVLSPLWENDKIVSKTININDFSFLLMM